MALVGNVPRPGGSGGRPALNPNDRSNDEFRMNDDKKERVDVANEPVNIDDNDEMVDTGVLHERKPAKSPKKQADSDSQE